MKLSLKINNVYLTNGFNIYFCRYHDILYRKTYVANQCIPYYLILYNRKKTIKKHCELFNLKKIIIRRSAQIESRAD